MCACKPVAALTKIAMLHGELQTSSSLPHSDAAYSPKKSLTRITRRSVLIGNPRQFASLFACCVTAESHDSHLWVAKSGDNSLFRTLQRIFPEVLDDVCSYFSIYLINVAYFHVFYVCWSCHFLIHFGLQVIQSEEGRHRLKGKISNAEFSKLVKSECGFVCIRTRKQHIARYAESSHSIEVERFTSS